MKDNFKHYKATGKLLTHPHVVCIKCNDKTTMFGTNLIKRAEKCGSIEKLIGAFECKACRGEGIPRKRTPKKHKAVKIEKVVELDGKKVYDIPKVNFDKKNISINLIKDKDNASKHLQVCWRPDLYLDWDRSCNGCKLYDLCQSPCRRLIDDSGRKLREQKSK